MQIAKGGGQCDLRISVVADTVQTTELLVKRDAAALEELWQQRKLVVPGHPFVERRPDVSEQGHLLAMEHVVSNINDENKLAPLRSAHE